MNVGAHLSKRAELNPGLEALVDEAAAQRFTFAELDERANRAANMLTGLGLTEGDRVAVLLPNGHQFVEIFYGAARAGLVVVPLNLRLVANELAFMLRDSGATVLVFDGTRREPSRSGVTALRVDGWLSCSIRAPPVPCRGRAMQRALIGLGACGRRVMASISTYRTTAISRCRNGSLPHARQRVGLTISPAACDPTPTASVVRDR
jgi:AMP-binding enzyme